jgi:hypothetical protein
MVGGACVSCNVSNCSYCAMADVCSFCGNGYRLGTSNTCYCPAGFTVSLIGYPCVSCSVPGCLRCDHPDVCASYNPSNIQALWIAVITLCVACAILLAALVIIAIRMSYLSSAAKLKA